MIDELLEELKSMAAEHGLTLDYSKALTAIYEIGLEKIGKDSEAWTPVATIKKDGSVQTVADIENSLKASQRKAWAKACGVAE